MTIARLGTRNLLRQTRRTVLAGLAAALAVAFVVFLLGIVGGFLDALLERSVFSKTAALQVHLKGYVEADEHLKLQMPMALATKIKAVANVQEVSPRIHFESLLNNGISASLALSTAFDPALEYKVCYARAKSEGVALKADDPDGALLGRELAGSLGIKEGVDATLLATLVGGSQNAMQITARGMVDAALPLQDKTLVIVPLRFAQNLLRFGDNVTEFAVSIVDFSDLVPTKERLQAALGPDYDVLTWRERDRIADGALNQMIIVLGFIIVILSSLGATGIANTMMMSVSERSREIGTMLAVGTRRRQILQMFLVEAAALGLCSGLVGVGLGVLVCSYFGGVGISFSSPDSTPVLIYPTVDLTALAIVLSGAVLATTISGILPAYRASRMSPVEALRS